MLDSLELIHQWYWFRLRSSSSSFILLALFFVVVVEWMISSSCVMKFSLNWYCFYFKYLFRQVTHQNQLHRLQHVDRLKSMVKSFDMKYPMNKTIEIVVGLLFLGHIDLRQPMRNHVDRRYLTKELSESLEFVCMSFISIYSIHSILFTVEVSSIDIWNNNKNEKLVELIVLAYDLLCACVCCLLLLLLLLLLGWILQDFISWYTCW